MLSGNSCLACITFCQIDFHCHRSKLISHLINWQCFLHQAFRKAWDIACSTRKSVLLVPPGRRYLVNATKFKGPCAERLIVQVISVYIKLNT